jgi:hypothetical protein
MGGIPSRHQDQSQKGATNMKIARLAGLMAIAILAVGLVAASAAFAEPAFNPASGQTFTATSGEGKLTASNGTNIVKCKKSSSTGNVSSSTLVGGIVVHFLECQSSGNSGSTFCTVKSVGAAEGLILTQTLHGILGLILPKTGTGVGLLLLPSTAGSKKFVTLAGNACTVETQVTGSVAGEVSPVGVSQTTGTLKLALSGGKQAIKDFDLSSGGLVKPELTAFSTEATEEITAGITYSVATEVT